MTPAFLLGPGRSGTTLLYKLVAAMPDVGYLSNYNARFPRLPGLAVLERAVAGAYSAKRFAWFQDEGGAFFNDGRSWLRRIVPTPVEAEPVYAASGVPLLEELDRPLGSASVALLRQNFERVASASGCAVVVSKRTANNRRVAHLLQAFPHARFVCLLRDGRAVARSLVRVYWWRDHRLSWCGETPRNMVAQGHDDLVLAARTWVEEMAVMEAGMRLIPAQQRLELHYDELLASPRVCLARIHDFLAAGEALPPEYWSFIDSMSLRPPADDWVDRIPGDERSRIEGVQLDTLHRWRFDDRKSGPGLPM